MGALYGLATGLANCLPKFCREIPEHCTLKICEHLCPEDWVKNQEGVNNVIIVYTMAGGFAAIAGVSFFQRKFLSWTRNRHVEQLTTPLIGGLPTSRLQAVGNFCQNNKRGLLEVVLIIIGLILAFAGIFILKDVRTRETDGCCLDACRAYNFSLRLP